MCFYSVFLTFTTLLALEGFGTVTFELLAFSLLLADATIVARVRVASTLDTDQWEAGKQGGCIHG